MTARPDQVSLASFLAELPEASAAELRAAAATIDALERSVAPPNWIERNLATLVIASLALFALGIASFAALIAGSGGLLGLGGVVLMVAAFPALVLCYAWSVRGRTALDREKMALNTRHFLPHGALYFGAHGGEGKVVRIPAADAPNLRQRTEALYRQATPRRWWW